MRVIHLALPAHHKTMSTAGLIFQKNDPCIFSFAALRDVGDITHVTLVSLAKCARFILAWCV